MSTRLLSALKKIPVPLFGTAAAAFQFGSRKAASVPRYALWGAPLVSGGLWFVWPAIDEEWKESFGNEPLSSDPTPPPAEEKQQEEEVKEQEKVEIEEESVALSKDDNDPTTSEDHVETEIVAETAEVIQEEAKDLEEVKEANENELDPYENLPEDDESTTCVICLINRQGPCRPVWRKFERCMKDNTPKDDEDGEKKSDTPSMSEKCDTYMLPWINCIQNYRNRYTLISNDFFQHEMVGEVEKGIREDEKIMLDKIDISTVVQVRSEWNDVDKTAGKELADDEDAILVEGIAKINLWDGETSRPIEIAFVKDQDGTLLGYEQFFDFKKTMKDSASSEGQSSKVGACNFHVNPSTTKSIQIFALYREREEEAAIEDIKETNKEEEAKPKERKQNLFYSALVDMDQVPVQVKETPAAEETSPNVEQSESAKETPPIVEQSEPAKGKPLIVAQSEPAKEAPPSASVEQSKLAEERLPSASVEHSEPAKETSPSVSVEQSEPAVEE
jgi:hypothetical protein